MNRKKESSMSHDERLAILETTNANINSTLIRLENKLGTLENKVDMGFARIENRLWSNFLWLMGMVIGLAGLIAHTQHWL